jgi:hypothetical protein
VILEVLAGVVVHKEIWSEMGQRFVEKAETEFQRLWGNEMVSVAVHERKRMGLEMGWSNSAQ